jgi:capsular polysaccharide biosynthesis protein
LNHWGSHNYGHFIIDCLIGIMPIMHLIKQTNSKILCKPLAKWQRELMLLLGVPEESMIEAENDLYNVEDLIFPSFLGGNLDHPCNSTRMIFDLLRQRCSEFKETRASKRILIDRSDHPGRQVRNWTEVTATARDIGFEIIKTENMSVREQIELFANAQIVIGETGAAMTNIGFCDPGTHFIETMIEGRESAWLKNTATVIGRRWSCMYCKTEKIGDRLLYDMDTDRLKQMVGCIL